MPLVDAESVTEEFIRGWDFCPIQENMTDSTDHSDDDPDTDVPIEIASKDSSSRGRIGEGAERAIEELDRGIVDLLGWLLETETRSRIYIHLRKEPDSTSEEIAAGTGLYPSTVREALAELHSEGIVTREKRINEGAGNNPYEYQAIPPSELVSGMVSNVQDQLNRLVNLDTYLREDEPRSESTPITISVDEPDEESGSEDSNGSDDEEHGLNDDFSR